MNKSTYRTADESPRSQGEIEEQKFEHWLGETPEPFTDEEIAVMARAELEGNLHRDYRRFLATIWERDVKIEALERRVNNG